MSTAAVIITILSLIAGFVTQAINSGSIFGIVTVPKTWLPYLTVFGTFFAGFVASLTAAGAVNGTTLLAAVVAGFSALTGTVVGVTVHQHISQGRAANDTNSVDQSKPKAA